MLKVFDGVYDEKYFLVMMRMVVDEKEWKRDGLGDDGGHGRGKENVEEGRGKKRIVFRKVLEEGV